MRRSIGMLVTAATAVGAFSVALKAPMTADRSDAPDGSAPPAYTIRASEEGAVGYSTVVEGLTRTGLPQSVARTDAASG